MRGWMKALVVGGMVFGMVAQASAKECEYSVGAGDVKVEWTAYKTTKKLPVKGTFNTMSLKGERKAGSLKALATGLSLEIDGASIESGNPGRNVTVSQFFFAKFAPAAAIKASVAKWNGDEKQGTVDIAISLNNVSHTIPFSYTIKDGHFEAAATMNMMDFALTAAFDSLHQACGTLHTGEDKVAKTWKDVGLVLSADFKKVCK